MRRMATMPKAIVATRSPGKYSGRWNCIIVLRVCSGCSLPAFEPNQPDEKGAEADGARHGYNPKTNHSCPGRAVLIRAVYILIGIHEVAIQSGRHIRRVALNLLGLQFGHASFQPLVGCDQGL